MDIQEKVLRTKVMILIGKVKVRDFNAIPVKISVPINNSLQLGQQLLMLFLPFYSYSSF